MHLEARMFREPPVDGGMLYAYMRGVVVANQGQGFVLRGFPTDLETSGQVITKRQQMIKDR